MNPRETSIIHSPTSICLLRLSAIGDTCNVIPTVRQIQARFPNSTITWIIGATEHRLLGSFPGVEFITLDKSGGKKTYRTLVEHLKTRSFDVLLHMHASMRANLLSRHIRARRKIGFDRARAKDFQWLFCRESIEPNPNCHVVDGFLQFAQALGAPLEAPKWELPIDSASMDFSAAHIDRPTLIISPCSSDRRRNFRNWSVEHYTRLADYAAKKYDLNIILTGGSTEIERHYGQAISQKTGAVNLIGQTSLPQLLAMLSRARVVVCPDSGPAHMANAVGTPVIGLFATSNRMRTGPYNSQAFAADRYADAVRTYLNKNIDEVRWGQRVRDPDAMNLITFEDVAEKLDAVMSSTSVRSS